MMPEYASHARPRVAVWLLVLGALAGCAGVAPRPGTYAYWVASRPAPTTEEERLRECAWVSNEIGRQQVIGHELAQTAFGFETLYVRATMEQHILALEKRGRYAGCFR